MGVGVGVGVGVGAEEKKMRSRVACLENLACTGNEITCPLTHAHTNRRAECHGASRHAAGLTPSIARDGREIIPLFPEERSVHQRNGVTVRL